MKKWTNIYTSSDLIIHEDAQFLVLNKPAGVGSQDDQTGDMSIFSWAEQYAKQKLHLVNRIDRPVSGLILCTKTRKAGQLILDSKSIKKEYLALVPPIEPEAATLSHFIKKDGKTKKAYISEVEKAGYKDCTLSYSARHVLENYHLIDITTETGRFHQIRAQLAHMGHPIKGDVKYGARRSNKDRSVDLHAYTMEIEPAQLKFTAQPIGREPVWKFLQSENII